MYMYLSYSTLILLPSLLFLPSKADDYLAFNQLCDNVIVLVICTILQPGIIGKKRDVNQHDLQKCNGDNLSGAILNF